MVVSISKKLLLPVFVALEIILSVMITSYSQKQLLIPGNIAALPKLNQIGHETHSDDPETGCRQPRQTLQLACQCLKGFIQM